MPVQTIHWPTAEIEKLCRIHGVRELAVFGSAIRDDYGPDSDIDFLVTFNDNDLGPWMSRLTNLESDLAQLFGRRVDVVPKADLKWTIRDRVLDSAKVLYVSTER
jgi:predicted nucleotidyltransferase